MPGHAVPPGKGERAAVEAGCELASLVEKHDLVFVLTDTRESRWLPTLAAAASNTPCINVALGFDSFVVIRSGMTSNGKEMPRGSHAEAGSMSGVASGKDDAKSSDCADLMCEDPHLGCYFCQDVVAPADSTQGRTLD